MEIQATLSATIAWAPSDCPHDPIDDAHGAFAPFSGLARRLLPYAAKGDDGAHDATHAERVWRHARTIAQTEGGDGEILLAAAILHDCVTYEKTSPLRRRASTDAAARARFVLEGEDWPAKRIDEVAHAVQAHSRSARVAPRSLEAKILQDADRIDSLGVIGVARCLYIAGRIGGQLYHRADPFAERRPRDETRYALDQLDALAATGTASFHTAAGACIAKRAMRRLRGVIEALHADIETDAGPPDTARSIELAARD